MIIYSTAALSQPVHIYLFYPLFILILSVFCSNAAVANESSKTKTPVIKNIVLEGNTIFSDQELDSIISPYRGRALTAKDIKVLKDALTVYYVSRGYINSGVVVPEQDLSAGALRLQVIEGRLMALDIKGNQRLRTYYIQRRVQPGLGAEADKAKAPLLNVNELQQRLRLLEQDPRIERLNANLKPGIRLGEAELELTVEEARPYYLTLSFDNHISPNVGDWQGTLNTGHLNVLGFGDSVAFNYRHAEGWESYRLTYSIPLGSKGATLTISASDSESEVVAAPFNILEITSESESYGLDFRYPIYRTLSTEAALSLGFEQRRNGSFLLGDEFAFANSGPDGRSRVNVLSFSQEWVYRRTDQVWAAQSRFDFGLDTLDATVGDEPDGVFNAWLGQVQWLRQFDPGDDSLLPRNQLFWRLLMRWTDDAMLSSEQFAIGGNATVRGYRENQLTRDEGIVTSLEWRIGVGHWLLPGTNTDPNRLQLAPFIDYGKGVNNGRGTPNPRDLTSVGIGLRWSANDHLSAQLYWAEALATVPEGTEHSLQDDGVHVQISVNY